MYYMNDTNKKHPYMIICMCCNNVSLFMCNVRAHQSGVKIQGWTSESTRVLVGRLTLLLYAFWQLVALIFQFAFSSITIPILMCTLNALYNTLRYVLKAIRGVHMIFSQSQSFEKRIYVCGVWGSNNNNNSNGNSSKNVELASIYYNKF